ncbi:hypothetical protein MMPV_009955 [Pyropia vietnamensis]
MEGNPSRVLSTWAAARHEAGAAAKARMKDTFEATLDTVSIAQIPSKHKLVFDGHVNCTTLRRDMCFFEVRLFRGERAHWQLTW